MKVEKKKDLERVRIIHNKKLFWLIIILIIALVVLVFFIVRNAGNSSNNPVNQTSGNECTGDIDCVPGGCCHPNSCVSIDKKPECSGMICSQDCSGPLDCGAGNCGCVNNKCIVVKS